jgi:site-specific DNA-cytosine methylase
VSAGHGFGVTSTIDEVVGDDERNDEAAQQRRLAAAAGGAGRQTPDVPTDDAARKRRRTLTNGRGRSFLGSRRQDAEMATSRQRERWIARLDEMGVLPKGEERAEALRSLGAQRQRADAYAAAAARAAPNGAGRPTPVAAGTSVPDGLEPAAAAAVSLDEMIKLPTYSMARIASESDDFILRAPFPVTNVSPEDDPMPPVPEAGEFSPDPDWRPSVLTDVYTVGGIKRIMAWFEEMRRYEAAAVAKSGSGLTRPDDLVLDDEFVQPAARGRAWYLIDHIRTGGASPIVPLEEASPLEPAINAERVRLLGEDYHDKRVLDQLCDGHRNLSKCPPLTVLSANHSGALRFHDAVGKQFADDSSEELGWLQPVISAETPLILQLGDEKVKISGFVATCPARIEPCNGVQQNGKVRTTTDKSWPKLEVLPDGSEELAVNPLIALDELAKSEFPKTTQFAAGVAVLMQAEPAVGVAGVTRDREAAASPADYVYLWKIDLQSAYRSWHNHPSELWMFGKQWGGKSYLDCRTQFGDASMVQDFSRFTDFFLWLLRRLSDGDERLRRQCDSFGAPLWAALDAEPTTKEYSNWLLERTAAGLDGDHLRLSVEAGYIDDIFGAALGYDRAAAMRDLAVGLAKFLGFDVAPKKIAGPTSQMTVLGASLTLQTRILALDPDKAVSYEAQVSEALKRKSSMRMTDFLSLTCKLVHAAQYRPAGRPYLTCMFTAMRQATRSGAKRVRLGRGVMRDLRWWKQWLPVPTDGVAFFPLNHFPPSGSVDLLEFAYDASGVEGLGAAMLRDDDEGNVVCYFIEHEWTDAEKRYHINVKEGIAGYAALTSLYPIAPHRHALAHGDNTTETITSATNKSRSAMQSVVLQHRADFAGRTGVVTRLRRVKSKDNVLADPVSRLAMDTFKTEARKLGASRFVKIPLAPEVRRLLDELAERLAELEEDGDPTSGTAATVAEVYRREEDFARREAAAAAKTTEPEQPSDAQAPWGFISGFCGADSMSFAVEPLGGFPLAGFDADETVRRLWEERTGVGCWGAFQGVFDAALDGHLDWLAPATLIYVSGSPCPDFSKAGNRRGVSGVTGGLWLDDCELGCRLRPPILIREMVTGIFDVDGGAAFWAAVDVYRDAGYVVGWAVRMARRHGDPTSRRRVFLVAVRPDCIVAGKSAVDLFAPEGTSSLDSVTVESCLDGEPEDGLEYHDSVEWLPVRDTTDWDGPRLVGTIGIGGMGWSVYDAKGPAVTMKTWGQGPGGATALYRDSSGRVRRLSPWEAMKTHSFPDDFISYLRDTARISWEEAYRLCGNSIPILTLRGVVEHLVTSVIKPQVMAEVSAAARSHREARELAASEREEAARRQRA